MYGALLAVSACGTPKRDFGAAADAGGAGTDSGGQAAGISVAGSSGGKPADPAAAIAGGGSTPTSGGAGQVEAGAGDAGAAGVLDLPVSECQPPAQRSCAEAGLLGSCAAGTQPCGPDGLWGACSVTPKTKDTCVTGNDDSCNGVANEDCACVVGAERPCDGAKGNCGNGKQTCANGIWSDCSIAPKAQDACTPGDDANCNGKPNEGCECKDGAVQGCASASVGLCKPGQSTCSGGVWSACVGAVAAARDCSSGLDNDCNGIADNTLDAVCQCNPSLANSCAAGAKCKSSGSAAQCVGCLVDADCNNGTCSATNKCTCTAGYAGGHCEFLEFQGIGVGTGDSQSVVNNVSHDGTIVVGYSSGADPLAQHHALRWVNGTLTSIPVSDSLALSYGCDAMASDANGVIVGFCQNDPFQYANGAASLVSLAPNDGGEIRDISKDGKVSIGDAYVADDGGLQAFHRVSGTTSLLPKLGTDWSHAYGTSGDGSVIVGEEDLFLDTAWYWSAATGTKQLAQQPAGFDNYFAADVSTDGKVIVGYSWDGYAIRWSGASYAQYQITQSSAYAATNQDGTTSVGTITTAANATSAAIWDANGGVHQVTDYLTAANLTGWTLTSATGVSDDGKVVVGNGLYYGENEGWIAHLP